MTCQYPLQSLAEMVDIVGVRAGETLAAVVRHGAEAAGGRLEVVGDTERAGDGDANARRVNVLPGQVVDAVGAGEGDLGAAGRAVVRVPQRTRLLPHL